MYELAKLTFLSLAIAFGGVNPRRGTKKREAVSGNTIIEV